MDKRTKYLIELQIVNFIFGFVGIFAKLITLSAEAIIFFRALFTAFILYFFISFKKINFKIKDKKQMKLIIFLGILFGFHWVLYYSAIKISTVAIGFLALLTHPVITVFLEPIFRKEKIKMIDVFSGLLVIIGILLMVPEFSLKNDITLGLTLGIIAAFFYSFRNIMLKDISDEYPTSLLMFYQVLVSFIILIPFVDFVNLQPTSKDFLYLVILALVFTAIPHTIFARLFRVIKAKTVSISASLQPVYATIIAYFVLSEVPSLRTIIGGAIIVVTAILESFKKE
ncbi:MAG: Integral membrane protein DUF6 [Candidatus Peregrinibacteria bacterium GW2011_GWA2_33_10]|nr:MAG: Integral membrane protein DUF6 [Candidatus Peregrinibacteria bacterium GW2011_GWA2_33_10]KKP39528.1 MAG: hypothetical protein UR30_C0010G0024 [Candidatus Peregrinibacteria bacterium GW2011_GWC2_33_13]OGJ46658.1 MAG: hypothetical protein A2229_04550 [Candidatus Peregrinibacteria bacterium RIFOXYA2_FULL_33_7]